MATMAVPSSLVTLPRKRRPRASAGEVFVTSESVIYLMDPKLATASGDAAPTTSQSVEYNALREIIYENVSIKTKPKSDSNREKGGYLCALRIKDVDAATKTDALGDDNCESQHVSIYIGKSHAAST